MTAELQKREIGNETKHQATRSYRVDCDGCASGDSRRCSGRHVMTSRPTQPGGSTTAARSPGSRPATTTRSMPTTSTPPAERFPRQVGTRRVLDDPGGSALTSLPGPFTRWGGTVPRGTAPTRRRWTSTLTRRTPGECRLYGGNIASDGNPPADPDCKGTRFDYTSAINKAGDAGPNGHLRDFGFNVSTGLDGDSCTGFTIIGTTNVTRTGANPNAAGQDPQCIRLAAGTRSSTRSPTRTATSTC